MQFMYSSANASFGKVSEEVVVHVVKNKPVIIIIIIIIHSSLHLPYTVVVMTSNRMQMQIGKMVNSGMTDCINMILPVT